MVERRKGRRPITEEYAIVLGKYRLSRDEHNWIVTEIDKPTNISYFSYADAALRHIAKHAVGAVLRKELKEAIAAIDRLTEAVVNSYDVTNDMLPMSQIDDITIEEGDLATAMQTEVEDDVTIDTSVLGI